MITLTINIHDAENPSYSAPLNSPTGAISTDTNGHRDEQPDWEYLPGPKYYYADTVFSLDANVSPEQYVLDECEYPRLRDIIRREEDPITGAVTWVAMNGESIDQVKEKVEKVLMESVMNVDQEK